MRRGPQLIEQTEKRWKLCELIGVLMIFSGFATAFFGAGFHSVLVAAFGLATMLFGIGPYVIGRFGAWWHHG